MQSVTIMGYHRPVSNWTFLSNHGRALLCIARDPGVRLRDVAANLSLTERRAHGIIADLTAAGYVSKTREGRRNRYTIRHDLPLPEDSGRTIGQLIQALSGTEDRPQP